MLTLTAIFSGGGIVTARYPYQAAPVDITATGPVPDGFSPELFQSGSLTGGISYLHWLADRAGQTLITNITPSQLDNPP